MCGLMGVHKWLSAAEHGRLIRGVLEASCLSFVSDSFPADRKKKKV